MEELGYQNRNGWMEIGLLGTAWGSGSLGLRSGGDSCGLGWEAKMEATALSRIS